MTTATISKMRWVLIAVLCLVLAGCAETYSWHQKMTVVITTPDGERVGSSVGKVVWRDGTGPSEMGMGQAGFIGEAVAVSMPDDRYLFVLLKNAATLAQYAVHDEAMRKKSFSERASSLQVVGQSGLLPYEHYPMLVTFDDINDPASVKLVNPANMAASFGAGYALKSITMEITDEPVTEGRVEQVLGWLSDYPEPKLGPATGGTTNIPFYRLVSHGDFIRRNK